MTTPRLRLVPQPLTDGGDERPGTTAAIEAHLAWCRLRGLTAATIEHRQNNLIRLAAFLHPVALLDATPDHLMAWRRSLEGLAAATICVYVSHVRSFFWWALMREHIIASDPSEGLPIPKIPRRLPRPISEEALAFVLADAPHRVRTWLILAGWAGLRAKEVALLRGENIHLSADPPVLLVASDATKGVKERTIPLSTFVVAELRRANLPPVGFVFKKADGDPVGPNLVSKVSNTHLRDLGIPDTFHSLRHRFGSGVYHQSHDLRLTQELLGHSSPTTTAGYAAWDRGEAAGAVEALPVPPT